MLLSLFSRSVFLRLGLCLILIGFLNPAEAFQIRDGNVMRVMQSGNPGSSSSYTVKAKMRIEGNGVVVSDNIGALEPIVIPSVTGGGGTGTPSRWIVTVCDLNSNKLTNVFPVGSDSDYENYENCLVSNSGYICSEAWAFSKGYGPLSACEDSLVEEEEVVEEEEFLPSAPENPKPAMENVVEDVIEIVAPVVVAEQIEEVTPEAVVAVEVPRVSVPLESVRSETTLRFDLATGEELLFPREDWHTAAPAGLEFPREHFSCVKVPSFIVYNDWWKWLAYRLFFVLMMFMFIIILLAFWVFLLWRQSQKKDNKDNKKDMKSWKKWFGVFLLSLMFLPSIGMAQVTTTPQLLIYEGELLDDLEVPLSGDYSFRFSFWSNGNFENTDVVAGAINVAAIDYYNWHEVQSQTLNSEGRFSFQVGALTSFVIGMFDQDALFLQVEVKASGDPDTAYEVIDVDAADVLVDRKVIASVPFAFNANKLDYRELGYGPGEIPYIDGVSGLLPDSILPTLGADGTDGNTFTLDQDGDAAAVDSLTLQFGDTINETLAWNGLTSQFEFSDDVSVGGNLIVTGTINGVSVGPRDVVEVLSPRYPGSIFEKDGTTNSGSMHEEVETVSGGVEKQVLRWSSETAGVQQDYDTLIRYTLPQNFSSWKTPAISLDYIGPGAVSDAHIDLFVFKEGSAIDQLLGTGLNLNGGTWQNDSFTLNPGITWNPGDTMWIQAKMFARNTLDARMADITLNYVVE